MESTCGDPPKIGYLDNVTHRQGQLDQLFQKLRSISPPNYDQALPIIEELEHKFPEALDRELIAVWCAEIFLQKARSRVLKYPIEEYLVRIQEIVRRLEHPLLLTMAMDRISYYLETSTEDPASILDKLLLVMTSKT